MQLRGIYHKERVDELVHSFEVWRTERISGTRAFQSTYDRFVHIQSRSFLVSEVPSSRRVGMTVCKWLFQSLHDIHAPSVYDYILPLVVSALCI